MSITEPSVCQVVRSRVFEIDPTALDATEADAEYDRLHAMLAAVPPEQRTRPWRQATVLLDVRFRRRARRTHKALRQMREAMSAGGSADQFEVFHGQVKGLLGPHTALTPHGFSPRLDSVDQGVMWARVAELGARLEREGLSWFATSGTLLGLVRHDGVVPDDDDVDLCVLLDAADERGAARSWIAARARLADILRPQRLHRVAKVDSDSGPTIDLFPAWIAEDRFFAWPWSYGDLAAEAVVPLSARPVGDTVLRVPRDAEAALEVNYGRSWRTPDPLFLFDWSRAQTLFATFIAAVEEP